MQGRNKDPTDSRTSRMYMPTETLKSVPEFNALLTKSLNSSAAFAIEAHERLLCNVLRRLDGLECALRPARTAISDDAGRFVRRSKDGGMVLHTQTLSGDHTIDWAQQSFALGLLGAYTKSSFWLSGGAASLVPLTPHLELEIFAPAAYPPAPAAAATGGGGGGGGATGRGEERAASFQQSSPPQPPGSVPRGEEGGAEAGGGWAAVSPPPLLFYLNMDPRVSLVLYPVYVDRYYSSAPPTPAAGGAGAAAAAGPGPSWAQLEAACAGDPLFRRFTSPSMHVRAFSATGILFNVDTGPEGRSALMGVVDQGSNIWGSWLTADHAAALDALRGLHGCRPAGEEGKGGDVAQAAAAASGWLLDGAPGEAGGLGAALLAEAPARDAAWRRFPRREPSAGAMRKAFGDDVMEAWWASMDGSARAGGA